MLSQNYLTLPFFLPRIISLIHNWPLYLFNYLLRQQRPAQYQLRNGLLLTDGRGTLPGTMAVVFIRREYGEIQDARTIIDIGANMGAFAVYAAMTCPKAMVYCYEPEERNFQILTRNINVNSLGGRVQTFQCAVASSNEDRLMAIGESPLNSLIMNGVTKGSRVVRCTTLQEILEQQELETVDLLKVNCEGAEYEIFAACTSSDFKRIPNVRIEYHILDSLNRNGVWLATYLKQNGYQIEHFTRYKDESGIIWARLK